MTIDELINKWWRAKGGAERSNLGPFITDLCLALDLPLPGLAAAGALGDYEYEGKVPGGSFRSIKGTGSIDLYKRGCFILEAKQSQLPPETRQGDLLRYEPAEDAPRAPSGARYDQLMRDARAQAENYAKNLPGDHPPVPFLIVCDIGRAFEIEFDYTGNGRGYGFFPDKQSYRFELTELADPKIAERLRNIWIAPDRENPRLRAAEVTSGIARRLAQVSQYLEESNRSRARAEGPAFESQMIEETSLFLMRIIFCMFAEDIELLPKGRFQAFLADTIGNQTRFEQGLHDLWSKMNQRGGGFAWAVDGIVKYFNGGLFESGRTFVISDADRAELYEAAKADWKKVEPAIFGTLLEQALSRTERAKLGAHYTPRPYVERLVQATIMDVLEPEWAVIAGAAQDRDDRLAAARAFHDRIAGLRILDPACGTGNFLYVAMEALQQLETKVIETIQTLGGAAAARIGPHQFFGLEKNPRAAKIAELVLWIGWLRFRIANDPGDIHDPVLDSTASINFGRPGGYDAVLAHDETGEIVQPPMVPAWPEADFIVGNPPFIGKGAIMRATLGDDYVHSLWRANASVKPSADFVMQWWDRAADILTKPRARLQRFGFVTTNSITQVFSRKVIERYLKSGDERQPLSLTLAVPDHPWTKASANAAAVRIAMTVAEAGESEGNLLRIVNQVHLDHDEPRLTFALLAGRINSDLTIGADVTQTAELLSNRGLCSNGMLLAGGGFVLSAAEAASLIEQDGSRAAEIIKPYLGGSELVQFPKDRFVADLFAIDEKAARQQYPATYQHLLKSVKLERDKNNRASYKAKWWIFAEPRRDMRPAVKEITRYIATVETAKHRIFVFVSSLTIPDHMVVTIADERPVMLGYLSSKAHVAWALRAGGWLGVGNDSRYSKSRVFDRFPFPDPTPAQRATIADLAEELDATRKAALGEDERLTMTGLYNLVAAIRAGTLPPDKEAQAVRARARIVAKLHDDLDLAVADAYRWGEEWRLAPLPPSEIVARLVALNAERAAEEASGHVRWLRPDYQVPRFARTRRAASPDTPPEASAP